MLFGSGAWWGLPPQHRRVLWERIKSMRSASEEEAMSPRLWAAGVMVLEMAVTQIRSTVQHHHWSPAVQVCSLFNRSTSLSLFPLLLFSLFFPSHWHMEVIWELSSGLKGCAVESRAGFQRSLLASSPLPFNPFIFIRSLWRRTKMGEQRRMTRGLYPFIFYFL